MRKFLRAALVLALGAGTVPAHAQFIVDHEASGKRLRSLHGPASNAIKRSFEADRDAVATFREILSATGIPGMADRIHVRASAETANAEAQIGEDGQRYIFYNSTFLRELGGRSHLYWAQVFVIAHEVGHHIAGHLDFAGQNHRVELEADRYAGFILGRMGATHDEAVAAVGGVGSGAASTTHPPRDQRVQVVSLGWNDGVAPIRAPSGSQPRIADSPLPAPRTVPVPPSATSSTKSGGGQRSVATEAMPAFTPPPAPHVAPVTTAPSPSRPSAPAASYASRVNTRLDGNVMKSGSRDDAESCQQWCDQTIGCIGYQFGSVPPQPQACELFSQVTKRTTDGNWRSGVHSTLALSLPVSHQSGPSAQIPVPSAPAPSGPAKAASKSVDAPLRFGYATRTNAGVVGEKHAASTVDQPLNCLLVCMNEPHCGAASFTPAGDQLQCTTYRDVKQVLSDQQGGVTVIHKPK